jgi:hypothetical protein
MATQEARNRLLGQATQHKHQQPPAPPAVVTWMAPPGLGDMDTTPSNNPAVQQRGATGRSDAIWEAHKPIIKTLYLDQGRSLKEVMEIMKCNYGLEGS